jgi:hypothetical protein
MLYVFTYDASSKREEHICTIVTYLYKRHTSTNNIRSNLLDKTSTDKIGEMICDDIRKKG